MKRILVLLVVLSAYSQSIYSQLPSGLPPLEELVKNNAPMIWHHYDEVFLPSSVEWFLEQGTIVEPTSVGPATICDGTPQGCSQVIAASTEHSYVKFDPIINRAGNINTAPAYVNINLAHYQKNPRFDFDIEIQYWFFWPYNGGSDPNHYSAHEGDWEGVSVILDSKGILKYVIPTVHGDRNYYKPNEIQYWTDSDGNKHPIIFAAKKSHALYNAEGEYHKVALKYRDITDVKPGIKQLKSWEKYEIIEIDERIIDHGIPFSKPWWIEFKGRWGETKSRKVCFDFGIFGETCHDTSNSPRFVKYQHNEWDGTYTDIRSKLFGLQWPPLNYDFEYPQNGHQPITNEPSSYVDVQNSLCSGKTYDLNVDIPVINKTKKVDWTLPSTYFTPYEKTTYNNSVFNTTTKGSSNSAQQVKADVTLDHKMLFKTGPTSVAFKKVFTTKHKLAKSVYVKNPIEADFEFNSNTVSYNSTSCLTDLSLINGSGINPSSVNWSASGTSSIQLYSNHFAHILTPKGHSTTVTASIDLCDKTLTKTFRILANCNSDGEGGGGIGILLDPIDETKESEEKIIPIGEGTVYPNPSSGIFTLSLLDSEHSLENIKIIISDQTGKTIKHVEFSNLNKPYVQLDLTNEQKGLYFIQAFSNEQTIYQGKLIKN